jgi:uncharacterized protein
MSVVFVDTHYWIASVNTLDQWHVKAIEVENNLIGAQLVTTEEVLIEVLNYFASLGPQVRRKVVHVVRRLFERADVEVIPQTEESFLTGIAFYEERLDKGYSLTDCISMNIMRERGITDVLTKDHHFSQEGFRLLF